MRRRHLETLACSAGGAFTGSSSSCRWRGCSRWPSPTRRRFLDLRAAGGERGLIAVMVNTLGGDRGDRHHRDPRLAGRLSPAPSGDRFANVLEAALSILISVLVRTFS